MLWLWGENCYKFAFQSLKTLCNIDTSIENIDTMVLALFFDMDINMNVLLVLN